MQAIHLYYMCEPCVSQVYYTYIIDVWMTRIILQTHHSCITHIWQMIGFLWKIILYFNTILKHFILLFNRILLCICAWIYMFWSLHMLVYHWTYLLKWYITSCYVWSPLKLILLIFVFLPCVFILLLLSLCYSILFIDWQCPSVSVPGLDSDFI